MRGEGPVLLEVVEGPVNEIVADSQVTRLSIGKETVWFRTSRSRELPLERGDVVTVIAGRVGRERSLIAIRFRRHIDRYTFRPHQHGSLPLSIAASIILFARFTLKKTDLSSARIAAMPLASLGTTYLQDQGYIVSGHAVRSTKLRAVPAPVVTMPRTSRITLGMQGSVPSVDTPWWHSELLECTNDAIIIWEMDGAGILYWNQAAEQLYGYSREEAQGKVTHDLLRTTTRRSVKEVEAVLGRYGVWVGELRHTTRNGRIVQVEGRLSLMSQRNGRWLVLEVNRDVTDVKRAAATGAEREANLSAINRAL
jgi:PAS domain S-box-containing protein